MAVDVAPFTIFYKLTYSCAAPFAEDAFFFSSRYFGFFGNMFESENSLIQSGGFIV